MVVVGSDMVVFSLVGEIVHGLSAVELANDHCNHYDLRIQIYKYYCWFWELSIWIMGLE